jgi:predicted DNA-binding transcriptional regulator YafY
MYNPTTRLLTVLELLQARGRIGGAELAERLEVDPRSVRRYVTMLQDIGIPITSERGRHGGYRLRPGFRLPPLMFTEDEATAVVLGLASAKRLGVPTSDEALAKINRVLPARLRSRTESLDEVAFTSPSGTAPAGETVLTLAEAARRARRVAARYTSHNGTETQRELSPYGVVVHQARWYLAAYDHTRDDLRTFRVDRMMDVRIGGAGRERPERFDAEGHVMRSFARVPWTHEVVVDLAERREVPLAEVTPEGRLTMRVESLDYMARVLASLDCDFTIVRPDALREAVKRLSDRLRAAASTRPC